MENTGFTSPAIAKEMECAYGKDAKVIEIEMRHEEEIMKYVMKIEEASKKAAESTLKFP